MVEVEELLHRKIRSAADAERWIEDLFNANLAWHLDDNPSDVIWTDTPEGFEPDEESFSLMRTRQDELFKYLEDPHAIALRESLAHEALNLIPGQ